jgi:hypothetical protein
MIGPFSEREEAVDIYANSGGYLIRTATNQYWIAENDGDALDLLDGDRTLIRSRMQEVTDICIFQPDTMVVLDARTLTLVLA